MRQLNEPRARPRMARVLATAAALLCATALGQPNPADAGGFHGGAVRAGGYRGGAVAARGYRGGAVAVRGGRVAGGYGYRGGAYRAGAYRSYGAYRGYGVGAAAVGAA